MEKVDDVCYAVSVHSGWSTRIPDNKPEAQMLWDADKVAHIGPVELLSYVFTRTAHDVIKGKNERTKFRDNTITLKELAPILHKHMPDWINPDMFYFEVTRQMAKERIAAQKLFLEVLEKQI
jgi:hypothetical protein